MKKVYYADGSTMNFPNLLPEVTVTGKDLRKLPKPKPKYDKRFLDWFMQQPINQKEINEIDSLNANLPTSIPTPVTLATGGKLKDAINSGFYPTYYTAPMLGFGDFLKNNAGSIGSILGAGAGLLVGNPMLGSLIGGTIGGAVEGETENQKNAALQQQIAEQQKQMMLASYNNGTLMAGGGSLNFKSPAAYKAWLAYGHASGEFAKTPGHQKVSIKGQPKKVQHAMGGSLDNVTNYATGGFHETNPNGGIPLGDRALVEEGEVRYNSKKFGDYVFSNRF